MQVIFEITSADKFNTDEMESQTLEFAQKYKAENVNHSSSIQINYDNRFHHLKTEHWIFQIYQSESFTTCLYFRNHSQHRLGMLCIVSK